MKHQKQAKRVIFYVGMIVLIGMLGSTFAAVGAQSTGSTFYVSTTGSDTAPGTQAQPFKTLARAARALTPGSTLLVFPGTYYEGMADILPSGLDGAPVTVKALYANQRPILIPPASSSWPAGNAVLYFTGDGSITHHVTVDGFVLDAKNMSEYAVKLELNVHNIRVLNSELKNAPGQGLLASSGSEFNVFSGLDIHHNGSTDFNHGVYISSSNNILENSRIHDNAGWGVQVYTAKAVPVNNNIIRNNEVYNNARSGTRGVGIGLYSGSGHQAYNNVVWGNSRGIVADYGATGTRIFNNTLYKNDSSGGNYNLFIGAEAYNVDVSNNIIAAQSGTGLYSASPTPIVARNNLFYLNGKNTTDNTGTLAIIESVTGDPKFVNAAAGNMHISAGGAGIDKGFSITDVLYDKDGILVQNGRRDIGAYESAQTGVSTATPLPTATQTATVAPTATKTATLIPTVTKTPTLVPTTVTTATVAPTATKTPTTIPTVTKTATVAPTATKIVTAAPTSTKTATPPPTATPTAMSNKPQVSQLMLVNASTGQDLFAITNGMTINTATIGTTHLSIRAAVVANGKTASVIFRVNGKRYSTDNSAPFALNGNSGSTFYDWPYSLNRSYTVGARPFTGANGSGTSGALFDVSFTIVNGGSALKSGAKSVAMMAPVAAVPTLMPTYTATPMPTLTPTYLPSATPGLIPSATITETPIVIPTVFVPTVVMPTATVMVSVPEVVIPTEQPAVIVVAPVVSEPVVMPTTEAPAIIIISAPVDSVPSTDPIVALPTVEPIVVLPPVEQPVVEQPIVVLPPVEQPVVEQPVIIPTVALEPSSVISFTLINMETGAEILTISDGMIIDIAALGTRQITIRANTAGPVSSVIFGLDDNAFYKVTDTVPFVLSDDTGVWPYTPGEHTLSATPYVQPGGSGAGGFAQTIHFTLVDSGI